MDLKPNFIARPSTRASTNASVVSLPALPSRLRAASNPRMRRYTTKSQQQTVEHKEAVGACLDLPGWKRGERTAAESFPPAKSSRNRSVCSTTRTAFIIGSNLPLGVC